MLKLKPEEVKKILIIRLSAIGDIVHCLPVLRILRQQFPKAEISWAVDELAANILEDHPYLEQVLVIPAYKIARKSKNLSTLPEAIGQVKGLAKMLKKNQFDLVIDLHGLLKSGLVSYFTKAPIRLVYPLARDFSYLFATHRVPPLSPSRHVVDKYLDTIRYLGLAIDKVEFPLYVGKKEEEFAQRFFKASRFEDGKLIIGLNPGASRINKQWPPEKFAQLGDLLIEKYHCQIIIFGGPHELPLVKNITSQMRKKAIIAGGKTSLKELTALIKKCDLLVSGDTGPLHIAVAVGTPVVALFGPTDYRYSGPYGEKKIIVSNDLPCAPCFGRGKCSKDIACIKEITVEQVIKAIEKMQLSFNLAKNEKSKGRG